jgi:hypothetical protein
VPHPALGYRRFDRFHVIVEPDAEVRVVPADDRVLDLGEQEGEVVAQVLEAERLVVDGRVDAEAAGIGQPRLPIIGTILMVGAFSSVAAANFQRSRSVGSSTGWVAADRCAPYGRCGWQSRSMSATTLRSVKPRT